MESVDRLYLNGYVPSLSTPGGLTTFMREHLDKPIPSPAVLGEVTRRFRDQVQAFATENAIPLIDLRSLCRKGLVHRRPGTHRYVVTPYGWKVARLYARLDARIFRPALTALQGRGTTDPAPKLSRALAKVDHELDTLIAAAFPSTKEKAA